MKRFFSIFCIVALCAVAAGCSVFSAGQGSGYSEKPILVIGYDNYEPYSYYDENGQVTGIDIDLATEACNRMGYTPQFVEIVWEKKNELLESGEIDCIWSCYSMTGRLADYQWAGPYMKSYQAAVVRADSGIDSLSQLEGKRIAVETTTKSEEAWVYRSNKSVPKAGKILTFSSMNETIAAVRMGYADALSGHVGPMTELVNSSNGVFKLLPEGFYDTTVGVAFSNNYQDKELIANLNQTLDGMLADGTAASIVESYGMDAQQVVTEASHG